MRTLYMLMTLLAFGQMNIDAQSRQRMSSEQLEAQKIAFITTQLDLSPEESRNFWPIYNEHHKKLEEIKKNSRPNVSVEELTEENAEEMVMKSLAAAEAELNLRKEYTQKMHGVISMKKIAKLYLVEREFKKQMLMRLKEKRSSRREKSKN